MHFQTHHKTNQSIKRQNQETMTAATEMERVKKLEKITTSLQAFGDMVYTLSMNQIQGIENNIIQQWDIKLLDPTVKRRVPH